MTYAWRLLCFSSLFYVNNKAKYVFFQMTTCNICFESWTNCGDHRLVSLSCGHLFGRSCIARWLGDKQRCPDCNARASSKDIRAIVPRVIIAKDGGDRDQLAAQLASERASRHARESQLMLQVRLLSSENARLREEISVTQRALLRARLLPGMSSESDPARDLSTGMPFSLEPYGRFTVPAGRRTRIFDVEKSSLLLAAALETPQTGASGILKCSLIDRPSASSTSSIMIHEKRLRDLQFSPRGDSLVLSASLDRTCKLTSMRSETVVQTYGLDIAANAVTWLPHAPFLFAAGLNNSAVHIYDIRQTRAYVSRHVGFGSRQMPISAIAPLPDPVQRPRHHQDQDNVIEGEGQDAARDFNSRDDTSRDNEDISRDHVSDDDASDAGHAPLLVTTLQSCYLWNPTATCPVTPIVPEDRTAGATCTSLACDADAGLFVASFRGAVPTHVIARSIPGGRSAIVREFGGGAATQQRQVRNALFSLAGEGAMLATVDEARGCVVVSGIAAAAATVEMPLEGQGVSQLRAFENRNGRFLGVCDETRVSLFEIRQQ